MRNLVNDHSPSVSDVRRTGCWPVVLFSLLAWACVLVAIVRGCGR